MKGKLCDTCKIPKDYTQGWVFCDYRKVWLNKGYTQCRGYEKGPHIIKFPGGNTYLVESFCDPIEVQSIGESPT